MELSKTRQGNKLVPIGCRFVPYDQWFLTHIPPTWKIRHLKQHILAKCLHIPWDARKIPAAHDADPDGVAGGVRLGAGGVGGGGVGDVAGRPPSPITFAPEERDRPISPIEFASPASPDGVVQQEKEKLEAESWEDANNNETLDESEGDVAVIPGGKVEVPSTNRGLLTKPRSKLASSSSIPFSPASGNNNPAARIRGGASTPSITRISQPYGTRPDEQIHIAGFTLVRFTTGQILEDDYSIAWYQLAPHELVELHASRPQRDFSVAVQLTRLLEVRRGPGGVLIMGGEDVGSERWWDDLGGEGGKGAGGRDGKAKKGKGHAVQPLSLSFSLSAATSNLATPAASSTGTAANANPNPNDNTTTTAASIAPHSHLLTSFSRHDLNAYIQPYWEGWVRCLRVVWRPDTVSSGIASGMVVRRDIHKAPTVFPYSDFGAGYTTGSGGMGSGMVPAPMAFGSLGLGGVAGAGGFVSPYGGFMGEFEDEEEREKQRLKEVMEREKEIARRKRGRELEWRERWVVIRDGWVYVCKERDEPNPTRRLPLAGLLSLRGVEHLAQAPYQNKRGGERYTDKGKGKEKDNNSQTQTQSASHKDKDKDRREQQRRENDRNRDTIANTNKSNSNNNREPNRLHRRSTSTPRAGSSSTAGGGGKYRDKDVGVSTMPAYGSLRGEKDRERTKDRDKERRGGDNKQRDKGRDHDLERENRRKAREREEREADYLRRWDEINLSSLFGKGKEKEKEKERERERERAKERERRERYKERERMKERERARDNSTKIRSLSRSRSTERRRQTQTEYSTRRDRSVSRERESHRHGVYLDKDKGKSKAKDPENMSTPTPTPTPTQSHRTSSRRNTPDPTSKSFIPYTRDEAEAAGMKILCAKFKSAAAWEREQREREARRSILRARMEGRLASAALAAAGGGDGKEGGPAMAASASTTTFGSTTSTSTLTLTGGGICGLGGEAEKGRQRRYTSTGPSLAAALATFAPPATVAEASSHLEGVQGYNKSAVEMDAPQHLAEHPLPPPIPYIPGLRKGSLPSLGLGLGKLVGGGGSSSVGTDSTPLTTGITPSSSASGSGGKFSIGLFGVGKDKDKGHEKEEDDAARANRKREERERKEREKRQKAIDKELKKEKKRREGSGLDDDDEVGSALSWRLGGAGKKRGKMPVPTPTMDKEELERLRSLERMEPITFAPMPVREQVELVADDDEESEDQVAEFSKSMVSIPTIADSATLLDAEYMEVLPPPLPSLHAQSTTTPPKPKLRVSTSSIGAEPDAQSDSDSCSVDISSPVFAHSTDSEGDDTGAKVGYRYGGYQPKEKGKEKVKTKDVVDAEKEDKDKTEKKEPAPATTPVRRKDVDRGEWIILDMGNDHAFNSILRLLHRHFPPPLSSAFVSDVVDEKETPPAPSGTAPTNNSTQEEPATSAKPAEETTNAKSKSNPNSSSNSNANSDEDDDDIYHTTTLPHPPVLTSIHPHIPNPLPLANPALPYPEWRKELVHRARRHGMREEGRALDLALHGWGREFEEMEESSGAFKRRWRKEEEGRRRFRMSFTGPAQADGQDVVEEEGKVGDPKRMSEMSRVSTINAVAVNTASAAAACSSTTNNNPFMTSEEEDAQEQDVHHRITKMPSSSSSTSQRISIDTFFSRSSSFSSSDSSSSESETEWVAWHTDLPRQRVALQAAKLAERERERQRRRERMRVLEEEEKMRIHRLSSLKRQPSSTSTLPETPLSPLMFSNPFAGNSPLEDGGSPLSDGVAHLAPLHPSIHPSIPTSPSADPHHRFQLPPRTQEEERRRYLETRRALEPSATSHITITTVRPPLSAAVSATPTAFSSPSSSNPSAPVSALNQYQQYPQPHPQLRMVGSTPTLGMSGRSVSPSPSSANVHAHGLRPSASFHSSSQRSGYGEHVRNPSLSGQGGRSQAFGVPGSPSGESFGGYWGSMGSSSTPSSSTSVSISNSPSIPSLGPSWAPRSEFSTTPGSGAISIAVDVVSSVSAVDGAGYPVPVPAYPVPAGRTPFAPSSPPEDSRRRRQQQYEFGAVGPKGRSYTSPSVSPPPPMPPMSQQQQHPMPAAGSQHIRTHSRSFSGTPSSSSSSAPSHVPYRVTVSGSGSGARLVEDMDVDQNEGGREDEEEEQEEEEHQVPRGGGTLPIHINAPPSRQMRGGIGGRHGRQSPRSPPLPPLSPTLGSRASPRSPSSPSRSTLTTTSNPTQTVAMPILTQEQIHQIESETEERLMRQRMGTDVGGLPAPPSPGPAVLGMGAARGDFSGDSDGGGGGIGGFGPRRSSSAGLMSMRSSSGPPRLNPGGTNTTASSSTAGSSTSTLHSSTSSGAALTRPSSILLGKSSPFPPSSERERERRVLRKRPSDLTAKTPSEATTVTTRGSTAPPTPTTAYTTPGGAFSDVFGSGSGSPAKKHGQSHIQRPKLSPSGHLSSPESGGERGEGGSSTTTIDAQSPTFARYGPSGMRRSPTTPTAATTVNNARSLSVISSPPAHSNPYPTPTSFTSNSTNNPNASTMSTQIQTSPQNSAHAQTHSTMASAKALLRRVRSGSSLRPGMGVHHEEETDGIECFVGMGMGMETEQRGSGGRSKGAMMERIARGLDSAF